ncbi:hypothetical protein M8R20_43940 [Pseudomonas sp. R2.Fl]|nr:hypothetical protein [Pseudomonas sp. R2.Fl]
MKPRAEFVLTTAAIALALAISAFVAMLHQWNVSQWPAGALEALKWAPAAFFAALLGALGTTAWHRRALARQRRWSAGGMTLRTLLLSYLAFPFLLGAWVAAGDRIWAASPAPVEDSLSWLPLTMLLFTAFAIVLGAVPAFILEYFVSRRYLHRQAAVTTGSA